VIPPVKNSCKSLKYRSAFVGSNCCWILFLMSCGESCSGARVCVRAVEERKRCAEGVGLVGAFGVGVAGTQAEWP